MSENDNIIKMSDAVKKDAEGQDIPTKVEVNVLDKAEIVIPRSNVRYPNAPLVLTDIFVHIQDRPQCLIVPWFASLPSSSNRALHRPVLILQWDAYNAYARTECKPLTSKRAKSMSKEEIISYMFWKEMYELVFAFLDKHFQQKWPDISLITIEY